MRVPGHVTPADVANLEMMEIIEKVQSLTLSRVRVLYGTNDVIRLMGEGVLWHQLYCNLEVPCANVKLLSLAQKAHHSMLSQNARYRPRHLLRGFTAVARKKRKVTTAPRKLLLSRFEGYLKG